MYTIVKIKPTGSIFYLTNLVEYKFGQYKNRKTTKVLGKINKIHRDFSGDMNTYKIVEFKRDNYGKLKQYDVESNI